MNAALLHTSYIYQPIYIYAAHTPIRRDKIMVDEDDEQANEMVIYGLTRSIHMLTIYVIAFMGMTFIFTDAIIRRGAYPTPVVAMFGSLVALTAFAVIYGIMRYFTEQSITYISANMWYMKQWKTNGKEEGPADKDTKGE
jgi:hypothetical protein